MTLKDLKSKGFKFDWSFEDLDSCSFEETRKCNHCKKEYNTMSQIDALRSEKGIEYFGTYINSCCLCYECSDHYLNILRALSQIKINNDTTWFVPNREWLEKISHTKYVDFVWFERLRLMETNPNNAKYYNHYHNTNANTKPTNKPIQMSFFNGMEY